MQLHHQILGQGHPLILLHGLFGSSDNWGTVAKHLSTSYQVISVDLRNHGKSPHHHLQTYEEMAKDLFELCDALNLASIHLLGHSLGGKVAIQFAMQYPEHMDKLIVTDMAMRSYSDEHTPLIDAMMAVDLNKLQSRTEADKALSQTIPNKMVRQFLLMNLVKTDHGLRWRINLPALKANYPAFIKAVGESCQHDKPSLFIRGEHSDFVTDSDISLIQKHFTRAEFASLPTGHWVHAEAPEAFMNAVSQFLIQ